MLRCEKRPGLLRIRHRFNVEPAIGYGRHHIGMAEAELEEQFHPFVRIRDLLADQVLPGNAKMNAPGLQMPRDLACGEEFHRHAAVAAIAPR